MFRDILSGYSYKLDIREFENKIELEREIEEDNLISLPFHIVSETHYRLLMHLAAITTNKDSVIAFEEPEIHTYSFLTKFLTENIAFDKNNQYFITTHSPYILLPLVEKTPLNQLTVNIVYMENNETKVHQLSEEEISKLLDIKMDALLNLDLFVKKGF